MTAQDRGWGPPGCTAEQLTRITDPGLVDSPSPPYYALRVRREVAPLFAELVRWLAAERARLGLSPLTSSGGYNKRLVAGSSTWSNHSWGLAGDLCAISNPHRSPLTTDMPPGTAAKAESLGMRWGGTYTGKPDPMHFEFMGTPADAARLVAGLTEGDDMNEAQATQLAEAHYNSKRALEVLDALFAAAARLQATVGALEAVLHAGGADQAALVLAARQGAEEALADLTLRTTKEG